jgi:DNA repair protein RadC
MLLSTDADPRGRRAVRNFVRWCRTACDEGHAVSLNDPQVAARTLAPLLAEDAVDVFAVACLSPTHRLVAWHVLSSDTCRSHPIWLLDVFVLARLTPDAAGLLLVHNHTNGDPTPTDDDARLTLRLARAADLLDIPLVDHLIVGDAGRYYSFREAGIVGRRNQDGECP